ncbi:MAG: alanine dehydrogenase [Rhodocyclaceae bacterium]|nr:alanine dehydrogenase [Rhodocyclaceae bacterium]
MLIGVPKEIKNHEYRVGLTPSGAHALAGAGHTVRVQSGAGERVGFSDAEYLAAGAHIAATAAEIYQAQLIVKVKELQAHEVGLTQPGQILFCYQHLAPDPPLVEKLLAAGVSCLAFETVSDGRGGLPLLAPMSRIAGRLAPQVGAWALQMANGGSGVLLGGVPGVPPARVVVIGAGSVGANAVQIAAGMGAEITVLDRNIERLEALDRQWRGRIVTLAAEPLVLEQTVAAADLLIGAVLLPGKRAPRLISERMLESMRPRSVIVDVAIDQGGISAASRPTTHADPLFEAHGVLHYCVTNMPAACARTATLALAQAVLPYALALADRGLSGALDGDAGFAEGLQIHAGRITHAGLAGDLGKPCTPVAEALHKA